VLFSWEVSLFDAWGAELKHTGFNLEITPSIITGIHAVAFLSVVTSMARM
jgi:hypothetical protein